MDPLREQVARARRRLVWEQFLGRCGWCLCAALAVAVVAMAVPRVLVIAGLPGGWDMWCLVGGLVAGLIAAVLWTYLSHRSLLEAAMEIDRRFDLRERVASSLSLSMEDAASDAGRAVADDAIRAVRRIEVGEKFPVPSDRRAWLPLVPAALALLLVAFVGIRQAASSANTEQSADVTEQVQRSVESARKKMAERSRQAKEQGLELAEGLFDEIERQAGKLAEKKNVDRTEAAVQLNDLAKQLQERQRQLGGKDGLKKQFQGLTQPGPGPADKAAEALRRGDFASAQQEIDDLQQQLQDGRLDQPAQQQLADQLGKMQQQLEDTVRAYEQAEANLQQQADEQRRQGNLADAGQTQQQLDELHEQQPLMDGLQQFSIQLGQCQQGIRQGNASRTNSALGQMSQQLGQMHQQSSEGEMLNDALEQLQLAKSAMTCSHCQGEGCAECQGNASGSMASDTHTKPSTGSSPGQTNRPAGQGIGTGPGGDLLSGQARGGVSELRDERVRAKPGKGPGVFGGWVEGPNVKGQVAEAIKQEMATHAAEPADPLTSEQLPRSRRDQAEQYFRLLREAP